MMEHQTDSRDGTAFERHRALSCLHREGAHCITAVPDEILPVGDNRAIGLGFYRGETDGGPLETRFGHLATVNDGRISHLEQFTDTHEWQKAVRGA